MTSHMKWNKRERNLALATGIAAIVYLLQGGLLDPLVGFMKRATGQMDRQQLQLKQYLQIFAQREQVLQQLQAYRDYFTLTAKEGRADKETESAQLLSEVEELARKQHVTVIALTPKEIRETGETQEYRLELTIQSSQKEFVNFLYALQSARTLFYPEKLQITATKLQETQGVTTQMILVKTIVTSAKTSPIDEIPLHH